MSEPAGKEGKTPPKSIEEQLDEALADSFPASDPVSFVTSQAEEDWGQDHHLGAPDGAQATPQPKPTGR